MTQDNKFILAPAKLNIFLKVLGRRDDGFHIIRSGINFINLFDKLYIKQSDQMKIEYNGPFKPAENVYKDCIISKTLKYLNLDTNIYFNISITKNIPVQGGLGSASTNAAALIKWLEKNKYIKKKDPKDYVFLGSDIPCFLFQSYTL